MVLSLRGRNPEVRPVLRPIFRRHGGPWLAKCGASLLEMLALAMIVDPQAIVVTSFGVVMAAAAFEDVRRQVIPNVVPIILCALWPFYFYFSAAPSLYGALAAIGCAVAVFVGGAILFFFDSRLFGGGDVKLLAAAALWAGPADTPKLLLLTGFLGGVLALLKLIASAARTLLRRPSVEVGHGWKQWKMKLKIVMPYGPAICAAALIVVLFPHSG
jgi:prepilin peptidase CpaA